MQDSSPNKRFSIQAQRRKPLSCFYVLFVISEKLACFVDFLINEILADILSPNCEKRYLKSKETYG
ncbi:hypothetical protein NOM07_20175, partial [Proteus terrae]|uniref:hypothetical protein n=1 Tax=Proteus terrae TaxID=1574161 RepID=UPI00217ED869